MECPWSQDLYTKAYQYAAKAHNGQLLPGSELPYIVHLSLLSMEIMAALTEDYRKFDGNLAIQCAFCHSYHRFVASSNLRVVSDAKPTTLEKYHSLIVFRI